MSIARLAVAGLVSLLIGSPGYSGDGIAAVPTAPRLGKPVSLGDAAALDLTVYSDGTGLPPGRGNALDGKAIFALRCASCHGDAGKGASAEELVGRSGALTSDAPDKTVGQYWPYATTLFDFIRRAMPLNAPGSLSADDVYALTAYLLHANDIIGEGIEMNPMTLPAVRMPNRDGFIAIDVQTP